MGTAGNTAPREPPCNKGKIVGLKVPFKIKDTWAPRVRLQRDGRVPELALFNLGRDSKRCRYVPASVLLPVAENLANPTYRLPYGPTGRRLRGPKARRCAALSRDRHTGSLK